MRSAGLLLFLLSGCGTPAAAPCADAVAHANACAGRTVAVEPAACDEDAARALLATDCAQLALPDEKADLAGGFAALACGAGVIRYCPVAPCPPRAPAATCADYINDASCGGCQFYACREHEGACGPRGYYLGFAVKYCERFLATLAPRMSPAGRRFLGEARDCLMRYVDENIATDAVCSDVKRRALDSHVACYHDNGFCQLPLRDKLLLINAVDLADVDWITALRTLC
jgi:hypothetical protein